MLFLQNSILFFASNEFPIGRPCSGDEESCLPYGIGLESASITLTAQTTWLQIRGSSGWAKA